LNCLGVLFCVCEQSLSSVSKVMFTSVLQWEWSNYDCIWFSGCDKQEILHLNNNNKNSRFDTRCISSVLRIQSAVKCLQWKERSLDEML
jgi:hypothetical protein